MATTPARRRLMRDYKSIQEDPPAGISAAPTEHNLLFWNAIVFGPEGTPYEDGTFKLILEFCEDYPIKAPTVRFTSNMFHPNIYETGIICIDILQNRWSPSYEVSTLLQSIQSLLSNPNPTSPANREAATLYMENRLAYDRRVRTCVESSWMD